MVIGQRQIHHRADFDLAIDDHGAVLDFMHPQNTRLWRVQNGRGHERAVNPTIRNGERAALHLGHRQLAIARALALFGNRLFDFGKRHLIGVTDHWHNQTLWRACRDAHMYKVFVDDVGAIDFSVHLRHLFQGVDTGLGEEGHKAQTRAVLLFELVFIGVAQGHHLGHVHLVIGGQDRCGVLRIFQTLCNRLAQTGHFDPFFAGSILGGDRRTRSGGRGSSRRCSGGNCGLQNIFFHDASILARALNSRGVNAFFRHQLLG